MVNSVGLLVKKNYVFIVNNCAADKCTARINHIQVPLEHWTVIKCDLECKICYTNQKMS